MKIRGLLMTGVVLLLVTAVFGCQRQQPKESVSAASYKVFTPAGVMPSKTAAKMIDTVELLESYPQGNIAEFTGGSWAIAVKNLTTGYTYYYDSSNTFLGRRK